MSFSSSFFRNETLKLQEDSPEDFKEFTLTGRLLDGIATGKAPPEDEDQKQHEEDPFGRFLKVLQASKYQKNLTFTLYKVLKNALLKK